jgi:hypothetical protein
MPGCIRFHCLGLVSTYKDKLVEATLGNVRFGEFRSE